MKGKILDKKEEPNKICYLVKISIRDYILSLAEDYKSYYVQREIVFNPYLDNLINTVLSEGHIPTIVLVLEGEPVESDGMLKIDNFKVLDGLQRTHRLKVIWETIQFFNKTIKNRPDLSEMSRIKAGREFSKGLSEIESSSAVLFSLIESYREKPINFEKLFADNFIWFEVWSGLAPDEEVKKMLLLNAGHKAVRPKHQLELLFNNLIPIINKNSAKRFRLIREKDVSSILHSKKREIGHFHFSHIVAAVLSYEEGNPVTTNVNLIQKAQNDEINDDEFLMKYDYTFFSLFIDTLIAFDEALYQHYQEAGTLWFGREVTLIGLFAAAGTIVKKDVTMDFTSVCRLISKRLIEHPESLNISDFERVRNGMNLSKINIGTVNKTAVYNGLLDLMDGKTNLISWSQYFPEVDQ